MGQLRTHAQPLDRPVRRTSNGARGPLYLTARRITVAATLACAITLGVFVLRDHLAGGEVWGPAAAIVGVTAGVLTLVSGRRVRRRGVLTVIVILWLVVALMGVTGTLDHAAPVLAEYSDQRPRPALVPLLFSAIAGVAIAATVRASRLDTRPGSPDREGDR